MWSKSIISSYQSSVSEENELLLGDIRQDISNCRKALHAADRRRLRTPAYVYDARILSKVAEGAVATIRGFRGCRLLYSAKACFVAAVLRTLAPLIDGFSCSSAAEVRLVAPLRQGPATIHFTSPRLVAEEVNVLARHLDFISFNSINQMQMFGRRFTNSGVACGMRINPKKSFNLDARYDPCRPASKLGVDVEALQAVLATAGGSDLDGLHIHNNSDSTEWAEIVTTFDAVEESLRPFLDRSKWINLGGGYDIIAARGGEVFRAFVDRLQRQTAAAIFLEPGAGLTDRAGFLVTRVIDVMTSDGMEIAIVDASINHYPDVLTYGFKPSLDESPNGTVVRISGSTCLAGDIFGDYRFTHAPRVGETLVFDHVGAYSVVKAHMFNGVPLPDVYLRDDNGDFEVARRSSVRDFRLVTGA